MSSFKFMDLPEEIRIMVVKEVVPRFKHHFHAFRMDRPITDRLLAISTIPSFRFEAQRELFHYPILLRAAGVEAFLESLGNESRLSNHVKELKITQGNDEAEVEEIKEIDNLFTRLSSCHSFRLRSCRVDFVSISKLASLDHLECDLCQIYTSSTSIIPASNITSIWLSRTNIERASDCFTPVTFPALTTLDLCGIEGIQYMAQLFPQIINLSVSKLELEYVNSFPNLKLLEFYQVDPCEIIERLENLNLNLESIRIVNEHLLATEEEIQPIIEAIEEGGITSIENIRAVFVSSDSPKRADVEKLALLETQKIKLEFLPSSILLKEFIDILELRKRSKHI